jgi:hypothetical protein
LCDKEAAGAAKLTDHDLRRRFVSRLKHCVRNTIMLLTVVICCIFSLEAADGESEI